MIFLSFYSFSPSLFISLSPFVGGSISLFQMIIFFLSGVFDRSCQFNEYLSLE